MPYLHTKHFILQQIQHSTHPWAAILARIRPTLNMLCLLAMPIVLVTLSGCGERNNRSNPNAECVANKDCTDPALGLCLESVCVACFSDSQCGCHEICDRNECVSLGASTPDQSYAAHGTWSGTPGGVGYASQGTCANTNDCGFGQLCNPLTTGCVPAALFDISCDTTDDCPAGPNGEILLCASSIGKCMPSALCRTDNNCSCSDTANALLCDLTAQVCREAAGECTPPSEISSTCPLAPQVQDNCTTGKFCSPLGLCVQCICDADCSGTMECYAPTGECVAANFCNTVNECHRPLESCNLQSSACEPACTESLDCPNGEYCDPSDNICRSTSGRRCLPDSHEPNDSFTQAQGATPLTLPEVNGRLVMRDFSLCTNDEDWYSLVLTRGDHITVDASTVSASARISIIAPDGITEIDSTFLSSFFGSFLEFTANYDGTYWIQVTLDGFGPSPGYYDITLLRTVAPPCADLGETSSRNDTPLAATPLYTANGQTLPTVCSTSASGTVNSVTCLGGTNDLVLCDGDIDYYVAFASSGETLDITLDNFSGDLDLHLFGPFLTLTTLTAENTFLLDSSSSSSSSESVTAVARPDSFFVARVKRYSGDNSTPYNIRVDRTTPTISCQEDIYDQLLIPGNGAHLAISTTVIDRAGLNDLQTTATQVALITESTITLEGTNNTALNLCTHDVDWFELLTDSGTTDTGGNPILEQLPAGYRVKLTLISDAPISSGLTIAAGNDSGALPFGSDDPAAPIRETFIPSTSASTRYLVKVTSNNDDNPEYRLALTLVSPPACDLDSFGDTTNGRNDMPVTAYSLTTTGNLNEDYLFAPGALSLCARDDDWYKITPPSGSQIQAWVEYDPMVTQLGLALLDSSVATLDTPTAGVAPINGRLSLSAGANWGYQEVRSAFVSSSTAGSDVYLMVKNNSHWPLNDYSIGIRFLPLSCSEDNFDNGSGALVNNNDWTRASRITTTPLANRAQIERKVLSPMAMCSGDEIDWYDVGLDLGDRLEVNLYSDDNEGELDLFLYAPGPSGINSSLDSDFSGFPRTVSYAVGSAGEPGNYLLKVKPFASSSRNYYYLETIIHRACVDDALEPVPPVGVSDLGDSSSLTQSQNNLKLCNDDDWYSLNLLAGTGLTVCATFLHVNGDIDLASYGSVISNGGVISSVGNPISVSATKMDQERIVITAPTTDTTYYIHLSLDPRDTKNTSYDLTLLAGDVPCP